jgi:hypothetical protein
MMEHNRHVIDTLPIHLCTCVYIYIMNLHYFFVFLFLNFISSPSTFSSLGRVINDKQSKA